MFWEHPPWTLGAIAIKDERQKGNLSKRQYLLTIDTFNKKDKKYSCIITIIRVITFFFFNFLYSNINYTSITLMNWTNEWYFWWTMSFSNFKQILCYNLINRDDSKIDSKIVNKWLGPKYNFSLNRSQKR